MPEPTSQATPQEPVTPEGVQVPEFTPETGSPQPEPQTEKPPTLEDFRRIAREEATRVAQSQVAKGETRIRKEIQEKFAALDQTRSTLNLSDQQVAEARQKIVAEVYSSTDEEEPPTEQPQPQVESDVDQAIQFMNAQIGIVFAEAGQSVTKTDPEFPDLQKAINAAWSDPNGLAKILTAAHKAAIAKTTRLQRTQQTAAGRVIGGGQPISGQVQPQVGSSLEVWEDAYKK